MWKCEKSEMKTKRSGWKTAVYWIAAFLVFSLAGAVGKEFGGRLFKPRIASNASINTESLNWQRRSSGIWGITLESPVELNEKVMQIPQQAMQYVKDTKSYVGTVGDLHINVTVSHYVDTAQADLEGAAKGSIAGLKQTVTKKGGTGFSYDTQRTYVSGNEAILVTTEYASPTMNGKVKSRSVVFMDFPKLWMVQTTFMDNPNNAIMAERIIGSIEKE